MFRRILVPQSSAEEKNMAAGTTRESEALEAARRLAAREEAQIVLLHVDADAEGAQVTTRAQMLDRVAALSRAGAEASTHFEYGAADAGIARTARGEGADLIVISPRQRPLLQTLLRPGVTTELLSRAPVPLLIWPEGLPGAQLDVALDSTCAPVIVPLDGSPEAERALPLAEAFARTRGRTLLLVTVAAAGQAPDEGAAPEERLQQGLRYLQSVRQEIAARTDVPVQTTGRVGKAASVIADLAAAHPGCIVVMTTHGRGRALRLLLGSVAADMLRLTPAPLVIVPPAGPSSGSGQTQDMAERDAR